MTPKILETLDNLTYYDTVPEDEKQNIKKAMSMVQLCNDFFSEGSMIQKYSGSNKYCAYCNAEMRRSGEVPHDDNCPVVRYGNIVS